jgi:hypothetical protein
MSPIERKYAEEDLAGAKAELAACEDGSWPRDASDALRWQNLPKMPYDPPTVAAKAHREYVADCLRGHIGWLENRLARTS